MSTTHNDNPAQDLETRPAPDANGIVVDYPVDDPGQPAHVERFTDVDERAQRLAATQVLFCFALAPLLALVFVVAYFWPGLNDIYLEFGAFTASVQHTVMGTSLGLAMLLIGVGVVQWARQLMADYEVIEERESAASTPVERAEVLAALDQGIEDSGISRRKVLGRALGGAVGLTALAPLVMLLDAGPWPLPSVRRETVETTIWAEGTPDAPIRLVNDVTYTPIRAADMEIGQLINAEPENLQDFHGADFMIEKSKAAIIIVRMDPNSIKVPERRQDWHVGGILAYSKICTHVGCPISLWEQQTHHLLCPCHQSTFDLGDAGKVVFGPAARALPQLPITVDEDGYLIARSDFTVPVGPSYPERKLYPEDKGE